MSGIKWKRYTIAMLPLMLTSSMVFAERAGFYTIIGPDGRIMVIDRNADAPKAPKKVISKPSEQNSQQSASGAGVQQSTVNNSVDDKLSIKDDKKVAATAPVVSSKAIAEKAIAENKVAPSISQSLPTIVSKSVPVAPVVNPPKKSIDNESVSVLQKGSTATKTSGQETAKLLDSSASSAPIIQQPTAVIDSSEQGKDDNPVTVINGEKYIQSEYLEQKEFNLEGKKRFYSVPDGLGRNQLLEREKGVDMNVFRGPKIEKPTTVVLSKDYQRIDAKQVIDLTGVQCFSEKQLEKAKPLKSKATLDFWPRPSFEPKFDFVIAEFQSELSDIEVTSYAGSMHDPVFYWPLPVFLDKNACVLEGVNAFYLRTLPSNNIQHQAIQGYLHVPQGAKYLLLTPLESAADLTQVALTNKGQVRLTPIR